MSTPSEAQWKVIRCDAESGSVTSYSALAKKHDVPRTEIKRRVDADAKAGSPWQPRWAPKGVTEPSRAPASPPAPAREHLTRGKTRGVTRSSEATKSESGSRARTRERGGTKSSDPATRGRTPKQIERQKRIWKLSAVYGLTYAEIEVREKVSKDTIIADIRAEQLRRAHELIERGDDKAVIAASIEFYEEVARRALHRAAIADEIMVDIRDGSDKVTAGKKVSDNSYETAIAARKRIDALTGAEAVARVKIRKDSKELEEDRAVTGVTIKRVVLQPEKIPVDEKGRKVPA